MKEIIFNSVIPDVFHIATPLILMYGIVMLHLIRNSFILLRLIVEKVKVHFVVIF